LSIPKFSIVLPVCDDYQLLRRSLSACYGVGPDEVIVCLDDPPHEETLRESERIATKLGFESRTRIVTISKNPDYRFHQAWVRREGFRKAKHDRILTVDVDVVINKNVLKPIMLVGEDDVGLASCTTLHSIGGPFGLWRAVAHLFASRVYPPALTGLYALWRPYWLDSENEGIKQLEDPRTTQAKGSLALIGEDAYLCNCMRAKHRCVHLADIGGYSIRPDCNDRSSVQFEIGRYYAERGCGLDTVLLRSFALARFHYLLGYAYQKSRKETIPTFEPQTYPFSGALGYTSTRLFWTKAVPMTFEDKSMTYEEKRRFRYELQDYMHAAFQFSSFANKMVLEIGSGAGIDSAEFLRNDAQVVSVDFSPLSTKSTSLLLREANLAGHVLLADARYLPFRDSQFDVVYSYGVIHHIPNVSETLEEARRVLRSRGLFMGMVYNRDSLLYAHSIIYLHGIKDGLIAQGKSESEIALDFSERFTGNAYTKVYTRGELRNLLRRYFSRVSVQTYYNVIDTAERRKVKFQLETGQGDLGWHLVFKSVK
jgi:ubiquinone/menaquinone biosynthesis C-methylase UbiE